MFELMFWAGNEALTLAGKHRWSFVSLEGAKDAAEFLRKTMVKKGATEVTIHNIQTGETFSADPREA